MRLAGAALSIVAAVSLAAAEPAGQAAPPKAAAAKPAAKAAPAAKAEKKATTDAIAASYTAIPLAERLSIQNDLAWTGDYNGAINGEFGERAIAAVKAFQKRNGGKETGVLNQPERAALSGAAKPKQDAVGWRMVDDLMTGARIGIPTRLMPNTHFSGGIGKWTSARGETSVETFRITGAGTTLSAVFERMKKEPAGRKPDYSVLRPDFFVIAGLQNLKKFYLRAQVRGEEVRGFTVLYDQAMTGIMEPVVVAMSSAYSAFPAGGAPPPRRKVEYASGVAVAPGHIVTSRDALDGCYVVTIAGIGGADRVAEDKEKGLVLLRVFAAGLKPVALAGESTKGDVTLVGVADPQAQGGGGAVSAVRARVTDALALEPVPAPGFDGAAALDAQGKLAGIAALKAPLVAGPAPAAGAGATLIPVETIRNFLDAQNVPPAAGGSTGVEAAKAAVVRVICVRK
ncbi:MAG: peptidoglycan-binding protein [Alphaproteobacteria bacterium]|nr:MAG: peptidoglycan-binding protein [Alphaproteobacteria bacterium]